MKLVKSGNGGDSGMDLSQMLNECYEKEQDFWKDIESYILHGIPGKDERGHSERIDFRVIPVQLDIICSIREKHPSGLYKSTSHLLRSIMAAGCRVHMEWFKRGRKYQWGELEMILSSLNKLERMYRVNEIKERVRAISETVMHNEKDIKTKVEIMEDLKTIVKSLDFLTG